MSTGTKTTPQQRIDPPQTTRHTEPNRPAEPERRSAFLGAVPNVAAFVLLGGVFYLGHQTGWQLPRSSALSTSERPHPDDWCHEHLVPESQCVECQDGLLPKGPTYGFCRQHGV